MPISSAYRKQLRAIGHKLHAVVTVADKGLTDNVNAELERALNDHELIKVRLNIADREQKRTLAQSICTQHKAELVQSIGHIILIFRAAEKPKPKLSNVIRPL